MDEEILSILGIDSVEDLTHEEYLSLLKEASVRAQMKGSAISKDALIRITKEIKRVRSESTTATAKGTSQEEVRKRKVNPQKVFASKPKPVQRPAGQKLLTASKEKEAEDQKETIALTRVIPSALNTLAAGVNNIVQVMVKDLTMEQKQAEAERKAAENLGREEREEDSEKKVADKSRNFFKGFKPPKLGIFDKLKNFFTMVALGGLFTWLSKPENQDKVEKFTDFIEDHGSKILLGIAALLGLQIGGVILGFLGTLIGLGKVLLGIFVAPALKALLAAAAAFAKGGLAALGGMGAVAPVVAGATALVASPILLAMLGGKLYGSIRDAMAGGGDFGKVDEELRKALSKRGITEQGRYVKKGQGPQGAKVTGEDKEFYDTIQSLRKELQEIRKKRDKEIKAIKDDPKSKTGKTRSTQLTPAAKAKIAAINERYNAMAMEVLKKTEPEEEKAEEKPDEAKVEKTVEPKEMTIEEKRTAAYQDYLKQNDLEEDPDSFTEFVMSRPDLYSETKPEVTKPEKPKPVFHDNGVHPKPDVPSKDDFTPEFKDLLKKTPVHPDSKRAVDELFKSGSLIKPVEVSVVPVTPPTGPGPGASSNGHQLGLPKFSTTDQSNMSVAAVAGVYNSPIPRA